MQFCKSFNKRSPFNLLRTSTCLLFLLAGLFILTPTIHPTTTTTTTTKSNPTITTTTSKSNPTTTITTSNPNPPNHHQSNFPRGQVHNLIRRQALSHASFHSRLCNDALTNLSLLGRKQLEDKDTELKGDDVKVVVVGVEHGLEVRWFAKVKGYHVYAFEAMDKFRSRMESWILGEKELRKGQVELFGIAASSFKGEVNVSYEGVTVQVESGRVDEYVGEYVDVVSMDVQGAERFVMEGTGKLVEEGKVGMFWVELIAQEVLRKDEMWILEFLDRNDYLIFDFVAWGKPKGFKVGDYEFLKDNKRDHFYMDTAVSRNFDEYLEGMNKVAKDGFQFLQTDLVAIRRDLATPEVLQGFSDLALAVCGNEDETSPCKFRQLLRKTGESFTL